MNKTQTAEAKQTHPPTNIFMKKVHEKFITHSPLTKVGCFHPFQPGGRSTLNPWPDAGQATTQLGWGSPDCPPPGSGMRRLAITSFHCLFLRRWRVELSASFLVGVRWRSKMVSDSPHSPSALCQPKGVKPLFRFQWSQGHLSKSWTHPILEVNGRPLFFLQKNKNK